MIPDINDSPTCNAVRRAWLAALKPGDEVLWVRSGTAIIVKVKTRDDAVILVDSPNLSRGAYKHFTPKTGKGKSGARSTEGYLLPLNEELRLAVARAHHLHEVRTKLGRMFWSSVPDVMVEQIEAILGDKLKADL